MQRVVCVKSCRGFEPATMQNNNITGRSSQPASYQITRRCANVTVFNGRGCVCAIGFANPASPFSFLGNALHQCYDLQSLHVPYRNGDEGENKWEYCRGRNSNGGISSRKESGLVIERLNWTVRERNNIQSRVSK